MPNHSTPRAAALLERLGLHRPELRAWAMYEWAITGMWAVIVATVFPIYFQTVAAEGLPGPTATRNFAMATTLGIVLVAVVAPVLGALTDRAALKKPLLGLFAGIGVAATAGLFFIEQGDWMLALVLFVLVNIGVNGSTVFYDALLPHIAREEELDRVSTGAFAVGYMGSGLLLSATLLLIMQPGWFGVPEGTLPSRIAFLAVAVWWLVFSIPLFRRVPEPPPELAPHETDLRNPVRQALRRLLGTLRALRSYRHAFLFLVAFLVYGDGIGTIIRMAAIYGAELGIGQEALIGAIVMVQFVGIPFTFLFGGIAGWIGAKRGIFLGLAVYTGITILGFFMTSALHFFLLAFLVGMVQGGTQALSRSFFASMIPRYRSGEFFGFFGVMDKFAGMAGPAVFALAIGLTGSSRYGILSVIVFFMVGATLLFFVDEDEGRRVAREAQAAATPTSALVR